MQMAEEVGWPVMEAIYTADEEAEEKEDGEMAGGKANAESAEDADEAEESEGGTAVATKPKAEKATKAKHVIEQHLQNERITERQAQLATDAINRSIYVAGLPIAEQSGDGSVSRSLIEMRRHLQDFREQTQNMLEHVISEGQSEDFDAGKMQILTEGLYEYSQRRRIYGDEDDV